MNVLDLTQWLFLEKDDNVITSSNVPDTFSQIEALGPSLFPTDLVGGVHAGWELPVRLGNEAVGRGIPVMVVSTSTRVLDEVQSGFSRYRGQRFLLKPFDLDGLPRPGTELIGPAQARHKERSARQP
ncbi:MAG: hypothetical protein H0W23_02615 [Chloroflexia bacterium]|nr:hypothetical protein [Chloroflexia bacterium]